MDLRDKNVLVTGGAHRVGKALSLAFAGAGANVIVNYHTSAAAAHETVEEIEALGVRGLACQADVGELAAVQSMVESATAALGSIQLLIHSASPWIRNPFPEASPDIWQQVVNVTLNGAFYCAHSLAPQMLEAGEGAIVNIVDTSVTAPYYGMSAHTAAAHWHSNWRRRCVSTPSAPVRSCRLTDFRRPRSHAAPSAHCWDAGGRHRMSRRPRSIWFERPMSRVRSSRSTAAPRWRTCARSYSVSLMGWLGW